MSEKIFEYWLNKIKTSGISKRNKELLERLSEHMLDIDLSYARVRFFLAKLWVIINITNKDLDKMTEDDIKKLMRTLKERTITYGKKKGTYKPHTLFGYKEVIRKFYQWLDGYEWKSKEFPKKVSWIKMTMKINEQKLPEEILTEGEVLRIVESSWNIRDKTLVMLLWESGTRISELLNIKLKDIEFDDKGMTVIVLGKTGSRKLRVLTSVPYVTMLLKEVKKDKEDLLFTTKNGSPLSHWRVRKILSDVARRCNLIKPVNPHAFRHSRATFLALKLTEAEMKIFFGWKQSSKMASIYVHLSMRDLDDSLLAKVYGLKPKSLEEEKETQNICLVCNERNLLESKYCRSCGSLLHITRESLQDMIKEVLNK